MVKGHFIHVMPKREAAGRSEVNLLNVKSICIINFICKCKTMICEIYVQNPNKAKENSIINRNDDGRNVYSHLKQKEIISPIQNYLYRVQFKLKNKKNLYVIEEFNTFSSPYTAQPSLICFIFLFRIFLVVLTPADL